MSTDTGYAPSKWKFDEEVTRVFDDMLARSIPAYQSMRDCVYAVGNQYVQPGSTVVDLGCSRGGALASFVQGRSDATMFCGVEVSDAMRDAAVQRFANDWNVQILDTDLRYDYPEVSNVSLTLCVLTLQFVPVEYRQEVLRRAYESMLPGSGFVLVEKVLGLGADVNQKLVQAYHAVKLENGYTQEDIDRKRFSLEGVLVPNTAAGNVDLLESAGFSHVDCIWRYLNFGAWVGVK